MLIWCLMLFSWIAADAGWWFIVDRRLRNFRHSRIWRAAIGIFMSTQMSYMVYLFAAVFVENLPRIFPPFWEVAAYLWHLGILPATLLIMALASIVRGILKLARRTRRRNQTEILSRKPVPRAPQLQRFTRRQALGAIVAAVPPLATAAVTAGTVVELGEFRIRHFQITLPSLPPDLDGLTIAHVTDLHIGRFLPPDMIRRVADATNALSADLVAFTGDLNDLSAPDTQQGIEFMRRIDPRHGLAMIEGNHDVMADADRYEEAMLEAGLPLLLDSTLTFRIPGRLTPVQFSGISWGERKRGSEMGRTGKDARRMFRVYSQPETAASIARVLVQRQAAAFPILLAHHPHAFDPAEAVGFPLVLSGHTHGGQIMLNRHIGAGPMRFRYWAGLYEKQNSSLFISNGVGNWFPLRINAPAELVKLTLRNK